MIRCDCDQCESLDVEREECLGWGPEDEAVTRGSRTLCPNCAVMVDSI